MILKKIQATTLNKRTQENELKKILLLLSFVFFFGLVSAADIKNFHIYTGIKGSLFSSPVLGRETLVDYLFLPGMTAEAKNISYDDIWYGYTSSLSLAAIRNMLDSDFKIYLGGGLSLTSSAMLSNQLALLVFFKTSYDMFYFTAEHLIFYNGLFGDYSIGIDWIIIRGNPEFGICFDLGTMLNTNYATVGFYPCADFGIKAGF